MFVDSSLHVYTAVIGWKYYSLMWSVLVASGMVLVPILFVFFDVLLSRKEQGSFLTSIRSDDLIAAIEGKIIRLLIVMFFVVMPWNNVTLDANSIRATESPNDLRSPPGIPASSTCGSSGSTLDDITAPYTGSGSICGDQSVMPLWWYLVMRVSNALAGVIVNEVGQVNNNSFRALVAYNQGAVVQDTNLKLAINDFVKQCYQPAMAAYIERSRQIGESDADRRGRELDWIGAPYFLENDYPQRRTRDEVAFPGGETPNRDPEYDASAEAEGKSQVLCSTFYEAIEEGVYAEATSDIAGDNRASRLEQLQAAIPWFGTDNREKVVRMYLTNTEYVPSYTTEQINNLDGTSFIGNWLQDAFTSTELTKLSFRSMFVSDALKKALPLIQAYLLMFIYVMLPFGLILSGYRWDFVIKASALIFFITFWSALWALCAWADESLAYALWDEGDGIMGAVMGFGKHENSLEMINMKLLHSMITAGLYILVPTVAGWVMMTAGHSLYYVTAGTPNVGSAGASGAGNVIGNVSRNTVRSLGNAGK